MGVCSPRVSSVCLPIPCSYSLDCIFLHYTPPTSTLISLCKYKTHWGRGKSSILPQFISYLIRFFFLPVFHLSGLISILSRGKADRHRSLYLFSIWITHQCRASLDALLASHPSRPKLIYFVFLYFWPFHSSIDRIAVTGDRKRDEREGGDMQRGAAGRTQTLIKWGGPFWPRLPSSLCWFIIFLLITLVSFWFT